MQNQSIPKLKMNRTVCHESASNLILSMPSNVIERILSSLPIRDAVRTSILSRNWRRQWLNLSHLVFDERIPFLKQPPPADVMDEVVKAINGVLFQHPGPILKFSLSLRSMKSCLHIDHWINFLSRNGIEEFTLWIWKGDRHKLPSCFFSCPNFKHLHLKNCFITPPPFFTGFTNLTRLTIVLATMSSDVCHSLITNSPLLEFLALHHLDSLEYINIYAPRLKYFYFGGSLKYFCIKYAPRLTSMIVNLNQLPDSTEQAKHMKSNNLMGLLGLSIISNLNLSPCFLKLMALTGVLKALPTFNYLRCLHLRELSFEDLEIMSSALYLITNSPKLERLRITACTRSQVDMRPVQEFMKASTNTPCCLRKLYLVVIQDICGVIPEMELIRFLLANSPALKTMKVAPNKTSPLFNELNMSRDLMRFGRASPKAEILYVDEKENTLFCF